MLDAAPGDETRAGLQSRRRNGGGGGACRRRPRGARASLRWSAGAERKPGSSPRHAGSDPQKVAPAGVRFGRS